MPRVCVTCWSAFTRRLRACWQCQETTSLDGEPTYWSGRWDFLLTAIGYAVGLGNIWGFPSRCYEFGGVTFLLPYLIAVAFAGLPLVFLEMAFGQATGMGPVHGWKECPIMTGIGWVMCAVSGTVSIFYNVLIAWALYYMMASMQSPLPWGHCNNEWNDDLCLESGGRKRETLDDKPGCTSTVRLNCTIFESPSMQYYERVVLGFVSYKGHVRKMTDPLGRLQWHLSLCLFACWIATFLCVVRGIRVFGKIVYVTVAMPFVLILALTVRVAILPGAGIGLRTFFTFEPSHLTKPATWTTASQLAFFSISVGMGGNMTLASHNRHNNNCYRDALIVTALDTVASLLCSLASYSVLGYMAHRTGHPVASVAHPGPGMAFIVYTETLANLPAAGLWSVLLFALLLTLGLDSQFIMVETLIAAVLERWPQLRRDLRIEIGVKAALCFGLFLLGLPMCCEGGIYAFQIVESYATRYTLYIVAISEILGVSVFYGLRNFLTDIEAMLGFRPGIYWTVCWTVVCPALLLFILVFHLVTYKRPSVLRGEPMTDWGEAIGLGICTAPLIIIAAFAVTWRPLLDIRRSSELQSRSSLAGTEALAESLGVARRSQQVGDRSLSVASQLPPRRATISALSEDEMSL